MQRCNQRNPPILPCPGKAKQGEDHPQTLNALNNLAMVLKAQGHLAEAEPLLREALEKSPGAQLQRFQRDFGQWIWSHTLLAFRLIRFLMTGTGAAILLDFFLKHFLAKSFHSCVRLASKPSHGKCLENFKVHQSASISV